MLSPTEFKSVMFIRFIAQSSGRLLKKWVTRNQHAFKSVSQFDNVLLSTFFRLLTSVTKVQRQMQFR